MITQEDAQEANALCRAIDESEPMPIAQLQPPSNRILEALDDLSSRYPDDTVSIFANKDGSSGKVEFCGYILYRNRDFDSVMGDRCDTPAEAVKKVIDKAGERTKSARIAKRIAELQKELAELEAQKGAA